MIESPVWIPLVLTGVVAAKFWRLLAFWSPQSLVLSGDFFSLAYPARAFAAQEIWSGRLPLWNPFSACGSPFIADIGNAFFYPLNLLHALLPAALGYIWLEYVVLFHLVLAGSFTYALARRLGQTGWGALFSALTFMLSGFLTGHSRHLDILSTAVWLPAIFWGISKTLEKGSIPVAMATGLFWGVSLLGGHPQIFFYVSLASLSFYIFLAWGKRDASIPLGPAAKGMLLVLMGGTALGFSALQWLPTWELARMSPRVQASFSYLVAESLPPSQLDTFWFPLQHLKNIDEFHGYLGIAPLMLSLVACFWGRKKIIYFFAGWGLLSAVLSLGSFTPVYPFLLEYFPGFSLFRVPSRWLLLTDFSWALVSGFGIGLLGEKDRTPRWFPWLLFLLAAAALTGWLMSLNLIPAWLTDLKRNPGPYRRLFLFFLLSVLVLALSRVSFSIKRISGLLLVAVLLGDLLFLETDSFFSPGKGDPTNIYPSTRQSKFLQQQPAPFRVDNRNVLVSSSIGNQANLGQVFKLQLITQDSVLISKRVDDYLRELDRRPLLDLLNVKFVLTRNDLLNQGNGFYGAFSVGPEESESFFLEKFSLPPIKKIQVVSSLAFALDIPQDQEVARLIGYRGQQKVLDFPLRAGRETAEWSIGQSGERKPAQHGLAPLFNSKNKQRDQNGIFYLATFNLPQPTSLERLTVRYAHPRGSLRVDHLWLNETDLFDLGARYKEVHPLVFENHYALPRFFPVYDWENLLPQDDPLVRLKNIDLGKTALIEEESPFSPRPPAVAESPANITVTHYEPQDISLSVTMPREGLLVQGEIYYPGWKVWIDGRPGKIYRVDHILRGVFLSPGEHRLRWRYQSPVVISGLMITLFTLVAVAAGLCWFGRPFLHSNQK